MTAPDANGWMSIETAPKDGTMILGYRHVLPPRTRVAVITWLPDEHYGDHWIGSAIGCVMEYPTHWQPLPKPPVTS
jgi:hypothetical protein